MRRSRYWTTIQGLLLVLATLAGATGCSQRSADRSKNAPVTQATAVEEQATGSEAQAAAPAKPVPIAAQLGSPSATTSIPGNQLPPPDPKFGGVINLKASDSKPWWPPRVVPPKGAPNVLLIMTDDCGFGSPSTFGGVIPTPALDRVAKSGLRYTQFHSTSLCSPTRAALITGRNHHVVWFRRRGRGGYRLSRLRFRHSQGVRHGRRDSQAERLRDVVVRQESQHALLSSVRGRAVRSMADRDGLRILLRLRRRRHEPVDAKLIPQYDGDLSV